jgi:hypothetical protein
MGGVRAPSRPPERAPRFRANPAYRLVAADRLTEAERKTLDDAPDAYGMLLPRSPAPGLRIKAVDRDTALLFLTLDAPSALPRYLWASLGERASDVAARLVLDGVLEVEHNGVFVTAAAAREALGLNTPVAASGRLARLSRDALRSAAILETHAPEALALWLYAYNREPLSPRWAKRLPDRQSVAAFCGYVNGARASKVPGSRWIAQTDPAGRWVSWRAPGRDPAGLERVHKLYVSPTTDALPEAFPAASAAFADADALAFKVGADASGVLRPDKLVAYFDSFEALAHASTVVAPALYGVRPQGVPFTAEITGDGVLSWGIDPPKAVSLGGPAESWRLWVARHLAAALVAANAGNTPDPWSFALQRARAEGINPVTWAPTLSMWRQQP